MKAAVLHHFGEVPVYETFPEPVPKEGETLIHVKAIALENVDKMMAEGTHFASRQFHSEFPSVVGINGVGELPDGKLASFRGVQAPFGSIAEKVAVSNNNITLIPEGVDAVTASAILAPALTSLFPLKWGTKLQPGETVLINGATGIAGKLSVQIAKLLGAERIIGTGRNEASLAVIQELGCNAVIDLKRNAEAVSEDFTTEAEKGIDIILDYLWGEPTELLIKALIPQEIKGEKQPTRLIQIGEKAGAALTLSADALRTSGLTLSGGAAYLTSEMITEGTELVWKWIQEDKLQMDVESVPLRDIAAVWQRSEFQGKKVVITP